MRPRLFFILFFCSMGILALTISLEVKAQTIDEQRTVQVNAEVQNNPAQIELSWETDVPINGVTISRKLLSDQAAWSPVGGGGPSDSVWLDSTVSAGQLYQYQLFRSGGGFAGYGYILSGIEVTHPLVWGKIIVVVDTTAISLTHPDLQIYLEDIQREGWEATVIGVDRSDAVTDVKAGILNAYNLDPANTRSLVLVGHVPVPYSGSIVPDGHTNNHSGAWPADGYYGELTGNWTDNTITNTSSGIARTNNVPGDGKFDNSTFPGDVELEVGRIDFANLSSFAETETQLLERYFQKNHAYRTKAFLPLYRGVIENNFASFSEGFGQNGLRNFSTLLGRDSAFYQDYDAIKTDNYLWAYGCGGGNYAGASGIGNQNGFASDSMQAVFTMHFGSYFGDWDHPSNNYLRAALASGTILTNAWAGRPNWFFYPMGMGLPIGYCARMTMNNTPAHHSSGSSPRSIHIALMGDPTLRMYVTEAPTSLSINESTSGLQLTWTPPAEPVDGYFLYATTSGVDSFVQVGGLISANQYTYFPPMQDSTYQFRLQAVNLLTTPSGSFYNPSPWLEESILSTLCTPTDTFLECPNDTTMIAPPGQCLVNFSYQTPSVNDDCGNNLDTSVTPVLLSGLGSGGNFVVGTQVELYGIPSDSCQFVVTVLDEEPPVAICKDITVTLLANGTYPVNPQQVDNFSTDNCQLPSPLVFTLSQTQFGVNDAGPNPVVLTATDGSGNTDTCSAVITVIDPNVSLLDGVGAGWLKVFPNPVNDVLHIQLQSESDWLQSVEVFDLTGRKVMNHQPTNSLIRDLQLEMGHLPGGTYYVSLHSEKAHSYFKVVVAR